MFFFDGASCPVCGSEFASRDDIVTCPICGTPHHRDCYNSNGGCCNEARHDEGFVWKKPIKAASDADTKKCAACGHDNPANQLYCGNCGLPLFRDDHGKAPDYSGYARSDAAGNTAQPGFDGGFYSFGGNVQTISDNELIGDIPAGDYKKFVGRSWYYYISTFSTLTRQAKKISFNLVAFLAHGLWFISRRMYLLGSTLLVIMLGTTAFQYANYDFINELYELSMSGDNSALMEMVNAHPYLTLAMFGISLLRYAVMFFGGLFGNHIYMKFCSRRISDIGEQYKDRGEYCTALESEGGVSMIALIVCALIYLAIPYIMMYYFQI